MTDTPTPRRDSDPAHPGYEWIRDAACAAPDTRPDTADTAATFFVDAGRVINEEVLRMCQTCPVRRECVTHSYLGGPGGTMIGAGYFGGFSLGQRKSMTLRQALARAEQDGRAGRQGRLL